MNLYSASYLDISSLFNPTLGILPNGHQTPRHRASNLRLDVKRPVFDRFAMQQATLSYFHANDGGTVAPGSQLIRLITRFHRDDLSVSGEPVGAGDGSLLGSIYVRVEQKTPVGRWRRDLAGMADVRG